MMSFSRLNLIFIKTNLSNMICIFHFQNAPDLVSMISWLLVSSEHKEQEYQTEKPLTALLNAACLQIVKCDLGILFVNLSMYPELVALAA